MDKLETILGTEDPIVPSSGFAATVMQRVREEAAAPAPIPFPWKRAIPGFILAALVLTVAAVQFARTYRVSSVAFTLPHIQLGRYVPLDATQALWLMVAVALAAASWLVTRRLISSSGLL